MSRESLTTRDLRQRTDEELRALVRDLEEELFKYRVDKAVAALSDTSVLKKVKRDIARAKTILRARQLGIEQGPEAGVRGDEG